MRRGTIFGVLVLVGMASQAVAEVRGSGGRKDDHRGGTEVNMRGQRTSDVWRSIGDGSRSRGAALNPNGAALGDLWPTIVESTVSPYHPWTFWSRHNGIDYDLVWTRWHGDRWERARPIAPGENTGDDLDADVLFDNSGRPYLVWWRDEGGVGRVYVSLFLQSRWSPPVPISTEGVDTRYPTLESVDRDMLRIRYHASGQGAWFDHYIFFQRPITITDDINPLDHLTDKGKVQVSGP